MNIVSISERQQQKIIKHTTLYLSERMVWGIQKILAADQEFLWCRPGWSPQKAEDLELLSVQQALRISVSTIISETTELSPEEWEILEESIMNAINSSVKSRTRLPKNEIIALQERIDEEDSLSSMWQNQAQILLLQYFQTNWPQRRRTIFQHIANLFGKTLQTAANNTLLYETYDFTNPLDEAKQELEESRTEEESSSVKDWSVQVLFRGEPDIDGLLFIEKIGLSGYERQLLQYVPEEIRSIGSLFDEEFKWFIGGELWQKDSVAIEDHPEYQGVMLGRIAVRKLIIHAFSHNTCQNLGTIPEHIQDALDGLESDIESVLMKIESIQEKTGVPILADQEIMCDTLEEEYEETYYAYYDLLISFITCPDDRPQFTQDILRLENKIKIAYSNLYKHCQLFRTSSSHIENLPQISALKPRKSPLIPHISDLSDPIFADDTPHTIDISESSAEKTLRILCDIDAVIASLPQLPKKDIIQLSYIEYDWQPSNSRERISIYHEALQNILAKKMAILFHAYRSDRALLDDEVTECMQELEQEIISIYEQISMLERKIEAEEGVWELSDIIAKDISYLQQKRFQFLQSFMVAKTVSERKKIGQQILDVQFAIEEKKRSIWTYTPKSKRNARKIYIEPGYQTELALMDYVPLDIRCIEEQLFDSDICFETDDLETLLQDGLTLQQNALNLIAQRKMLVYFFAVKRADEIAMHPGWDAKKRTPLKSERKEIKKLAKKLFWETAFILVRLALTSRSVEQIRRRRPNISEHQELYNKACSYLSEIDGQITRIDPKKSPSLLLFWENFLEYVRDFSNMLLQQQEVVGSFSLDEIQQIFSDRVREIRLRLEIRKKYLDPRLEKQYIFLQKRIDEVMKSLCADMKEDRIQY